MRELTILFISASVIGIMFIIGKFPGNEFFKNKIASIFSDLYLFNFSEVVKKVTEGICHCFFLSFSIPMFTSEEEQSVKN